jgi:hypothetical protein
MALTSQKEMAAKLALEIADKQKERIEVSVIEGAKNEIVKERKLQESFMREVVADKGYMISVPDTEVVLYEDEGYQLLYCNNIDHPAKISFLMALKQAARHITGRTPITSQGYIAVPMSRDQFNLILASHQRAKHTIDSYKKRLDELEKEIAPLKYIDHLIKKHKLDTLE